MISEAWTQMRSIEVVITPVKQFKEDMKKSHIFAPSTFF